jgi:hypothetical protein
MIGLEATMEPGILTREAVEVLKQAAWDGDRVARMLLGDLGGGPWPWSVAEDPGTPQIIREAQRRPLALD